MVFFSNVVEGSDIVLRRKLETNEHLPLQLRKKNCIYFKYYLKNVIYYYFAFVSKIIIIVLY